MQRIGYQGAPGAYSEEAVLRACGPASQGVPLRENRDVTRAIASGAVDLGVLPIENTLAGSVLASYDAILAEPAIRAVGEVVMSIHHCILGVPGASLSGLQSIESHPVALAQCAAFFARHDSLRLHAVYDTAGAARAIAADGDPSRGALAGRLAAERYGLDVLAADVEDRPDNTTRFLVLGARAVALEAGTPARTLLVVTVANRPGALAALLQPLAARALNLVKLESRPTGEAWTYRFVLEFEHVAGDAAADEALAEVRPMCDSLRVIGSYAAGAVAPNAAGRLAPSGRAGLD